MIMGKRALAGLSVVGALLLVVVMTRGTRMVQGRVAGARSAEVQVVTAAGKDDPANLKGEQVRAAIARGVETFGGLNVLCNVAGGSSMRDDRVTDAPEEEFWRVIRLDLFGTFLGCRFGIPAIVAWSAG